jgi:hypothetical protein
LIRFKDYEITLKKQYRPPSPDAWRSSSSSRNRTSLRINRIRIEKERHFVYGLETTSNFESVQARFEDNRITVFVPKSQAEQWTQTAQVGI